VPELPEVEVVRAGLDRWATGRVIEQVDVLHPRAVRRHSDRAGDFAAALAGSTLRCASRRGKYLWCPLDHEGRPDGHALVVHLGMSGQLLVLPADAADGPHLRVRITFRDDGPQLRFVDQRTFGGMLVDDLVDDGDGGRVPASVQHIARDPLDPCFDQRAAIARVRAKDVEIKRVLLDQQAVSGIGNIYADESLWRARLHGARPARGLSARAIGVLLGHARAVMGEALAAGGTSFDALYVDVEGRGGYFERSLAVYGREGEPCPACGSAIRRSAFMNRSSYWCPRCQPPPRRSR
jgi:formamidopyrimidine-DNA glycosylase